MSQNYFSLEKLHKFNYFPINLFKKRVLNSLNFYNSFNDYDYFIKDYESQSTKYFSRQSVKNFNFRIKSSDSIFFLLGIFPIVSINLTLKVNIS